MRAITLIPVGRFTVKCGVAGPVTEPIAQRAAGASASDDLPLWAAISSVIIVGLTVELLIAFTVTNSSGWHARPCTPTGVHFILHAEALAAIRWARRR